MYKLSVLFIALILACSRVQACTTASTAHVQKVVKESTRLNEAFKKSADESDDVKYRRLRKQLEHYEESTAIPCLRRAVILLNQATDTSLVNVLFAHALSHENSADETASEVLATVFVKHSDAFMAVWRKSSTDTKKAVSVRIESGWGLIKAKYPLRKQQQIELRLKQVMTK